MLVIFLMFSHATLQVESNGTDSVKVYWKQILHSGSRLRIWICRSRFFTQHHLLLFQVGVEWGRKASMGKLIVPIGLSLVSIGILNPDLVDWAGDSSLELDENTTLLAGDVVEAMIQIIILSFVHHATIIYLGN